MFVGVWHRGRAALTVPAKVYSSTHAPGSPPGALFVVATTAVDRRRPAFADVALSLRHGYQYFNLRAPPGHKPGLCSWPLLVRRPARRLRLRYSYARVIALALP